LANGPKITLSLTDHLNAWLLKLQLRNRIPTKQILSNSRFKIVKALSIAD